MPEERTRPATPSQDEAAKDAKVIAGLLSMLKRHGLPTAAILTFAGGYWNNANTMATKSDLSQVQQQVSKIESKVDAIARHDGIIVASDR